MPHNINTITVIGDVLQDSLYVDKRRVAKSPGGTFFVARMIDSAVKAAATGVVPRVLTYKRSEADVEALNLLESKWFIRQFTRRGSRDRRGIQRADGRPVFRCVETPRPSIPVEPRPKTPAPAKPELEETTAPDILVIEDLNVLASGSMDPTPPPQLRRRGIGSEQWCTLQQRPDEWGHHLKAIANTDRHGYCPRIFAMINRHLPTFKDGLWYELHRAHREWTLVVIYADILRWDGLTISKQVSWERTAQDFLTQLYSDSTLSLLADFQHVVVRFGVTGAIHSYRVGKKDTKRKVHRLYFDPIAPQYGIFRDATIDGDLIGTNSIYVASIIRELVEFLNPKVSVQPSDRSRLTDCRNCFNEYAIAETIGDGIRHAVLRSQHHFAKGYGESRRSVRQFFEGSGFSPDLFRSGGDGHKRIGDERIPVGDLSWNILNQAAGYRLIEVAHRIVVHGVDKALNWQKEDDDKKRPVWAPVVKFEGQGEDRVIELVERREIESYRSVHNMLREARRAGDRRPLSIAVFGPPGSGKSYSIKVLAESAGFYLQNTVREVNLAEHTRPDILLEVVEWAKTVQDDTGTPMVFFDEFDCPFEDRELGWLKYFLSMMEDWKSPKGARGGPPIFVFAGGTSYTYRDFSRGGLGGKEQELRFAQAKGPDFVSRLSGHIDIVGPNPTSEYDQAYVIRRALVLRRLLRRKRPPSLSGAFDKWFQREVIRAMLKVSTYKHGSRSMRAIVDMCVRFGGDRGRYVATSLPPAHQLDMHVDGKEFLRRIEDARIELESEDERDGRRPAGSSPSDPAVDRVVQERVAIGHEGDGSERKAMEQVIRP